MSIITKSGSLIILIIKAREVQNFLSSLKENFPREPIEIHEERCREIQSTLESAKISVSENGDVRYIWENNDWYIYNKYRGILYNSIVLMGKPNYWFLRYNEKGWEHVGDYVDNPFNTKLKVSYELLSLDSPHIEYIIDEEYQ